MTNKIKIALSTGELDLVCNKEWILTKLRIIEKVYELFGGLALLMQQQVRQHAMALPQEAIKSSPKISRGENYRSLPYVMLDYPRHFTKESALAIRTLFWWGNFFSINLHLAGAGKEKAIPVLNRSFTVLQQDGYWVCIHADPWHHHFEEDNYIPIRNITAAEFAAMLQREPFIKIAKRISLQQWAAAPEFLAQHFIKMLELLQINFQDGETGLLPGTPTTGSDL